MWANLQSCGSEESGVTTGEGNYALTRFPRALQGVISYSRGLIKVLDRPQLESLSCECYSVVKRQTAMLLDYMPQRAVVTNTDDIPVVTLPTRPA